MSLLSESIFPGEATSWTPERIHARARELEPLLPGMPLSDWLDCLATWTAAWSNPAHAFRVECDRLLSEATGFSLPVVREGLNRTFSAWDRRGMESLLQTDLAVSAHASRAGRDSSSRIPVVPRHLVQILAGNVPPPVVQCLMAALLLRVPCFLKASSRAPLFPRLLSSSLWTMIPETRQSIQVGSWSSDDRACTAALLAHADTVVVYGNHATLEAIQVQLGPDARFVGRGHRVSVVYLARETLQLPGVIEIARRIAFDTALWDQAGCLSPQVVLAEEGGEVSPGELAVLLAGDSLPELASRLPPGRCSLEDQARQVQRRAVLEFGPGYWSGPWGAVAWVDEPEFVGPVSGRTLLVRGVKSAADACTYLRPLRAHLQAIALEAPPERTELPGALLNAGAWRICPVGCLQSPPATWGGDGLPLLGALVRWADIDASTPRL